MNSQQNQYNLFFNTNHLPVNQMPPFYLNPFAPFFNFPINYQENKQIKNCQNSKNLTESAVQTQQSCFQTKIVPEKAQNNTQQDDLTQKQFPFPNKQKLFDVFKCTSSKKRDIQQKIDVICSPKTKLLNCFYKSLGQKIIRFKKTKQQIIKFLIRRAWKKQEDGVGEARQKYYSQYKSMNSTYLTNIFNDPIFLNAYQNMLRNFEQEFDSYNEQRFNRFYDYLLNCYVNNNLNQFKTSKQCKSKLPYPLFWKQHILKIANDLYQTYCQNGNKSIQEHDAKQTVRAKSRRIQRRFTEVKNKQ